MTGIPEKDKNLNTASPEKSPSIECLYASEDDPLVIEPSPFFRYGPNDEIIVDFLLATFRIPPQSWQAIAHLGPHSGHGWLASFDLFLETQLDALLYSFLLHSRHSRHCLTFRKLIINPAMAIDEF